MGGEKHTKNVQSFYIPMARVLFSRKVAFPFLHDRVRTVVCELICMPHNRLPTFPVMGGSCSFRPRDGDPGVLGA